MQFVYHQLAKSYPEHSLFILIGEMETIALKWSWFTPHTTCKMLLL